MYNQLLGSGLNLISWFFRILFSWLKHLRLNVASIDPKDMDPNKSKAKRCLFPVGPQDRAQINNDLNANLEQMNQEESLRMQEKWNFDLNSGKPLEGPLKWEKCEEQPTVNEKLSDEQHKEIKVESKTTTKEQALQNTPQKSWKFSQF